MKTYKDRSIYQSAFQLAKEVHILSFKMPKYEIFELGSQGLSKTLASVACQTFTDYEHLIIDGASTNGSVEVIKQ